MFKQLEKLYFSSDDPFKLMMHLGNAALIWIRKDICTNQALFTSQNKHVCEFRYEIQQEMDFFSLEEVLKWIMDSYFSQTHLLMMDLLQFCLLQMLSGGLEWCGLLVEYCDVFISSLDSHSDGTHSLQSIHWWDTDVMTHFSKSDEETNSSTSWMAWVGAHFQHMFIFDWTVSLSNLAQSIIVILSISVHAML